MSGPDKRPGPAYLPGDPTPPVDAMIRVDHAGEFGAVRIYEGQLAVLPPGPARDAVQEMAAQEQEHLATFNALIADRGVRPTALSPLLACRRLCARRVDRADGAACGDGMHGCGRRSDRRALSRASRASR